MQVRVKGEVIHDVDDHIHEESNMWLRHGGCFYKYYCGSTQKLAIPCTCEQWVEAWNKLEIYEKEDRLCM